MENYTPTNWKNGDVITSDKLNNIENGISNNFDCDDVFVSNVIFLHTSTEDEVTFTNVSMTASEIEEARDGGNFICLNVIDGLRGMEESAFSHSNENGAYFYSYLIPNPNNFATFYIVHDDGSVSLYFEQGN